MAVWDTLVVLVERGHLNGLRSKGCIYPLVANTRSRLPPLPTLRPIWARSWELDDDDDDDDEDDVLPWKEESAFYTARARIWGSSGL